MGYRDDLEAAHARIAALEAENRRLRMTEEPKKTKAVPTMSVFREFWRVLGEWIGSDFAKALAFLAGVFGAIAVLVVWLDCLFFAFDHDPKPHLCASFPIWLRHGVLFGLPAAIAFAFLAVAWTKARRRVKERMRP